MRNSGWYIWARRYLIQWAALLTNRIGVVENCLKYNQLENKVGNEPNQLKYSSGLVQ